MLHKLLISYDFSPMDVSSANKNTRIYPVKCHKHLGITLSADWKLSNHINTIFAKTSKQVAVLRKLKFKISRNVLETMYLSFIRPIIDNVSFSRIKFD
jgi:hypothetical protein